jgi:hypothetical protein
VGRAKRLVLAMVSVVMVTTASAAPVTVFALGESQVTLSCSDGTKTDLSVDVATLLQLKDAVEAMSLYPAGLSCSLVETPSVGGLAPIARAQGGPQSFVVGGGQWSYCPGNLINVAVNARMRADGGFEGTINQTYSYEHAGCLPPFPPETSLIRSKVTCVNVVDNNAYVSSRVTRTEGFYTYAAEDTYFQWKFVDGGNPAAGQAPGPDTRQGQYSAADASCPTDPMTEPPFLLLRGNLLVRDNS